MKTILKSKALRFIITGLWCALIFLFSSNSADTSGKQSGRIVGIVIDVFVPDYDSLSEARQEQITDTVTFIVRKTAHFTEYLVLGALVFWCLYKTKEKRLRTVLAAVLTSLYSVTDELHQLFSDGRSCELRDVLIDTCGGIVGALGALLIFVLWEKRTKSFKQI
ncbi:MAG: VanZ family protein [Ruminococcus sp.]|nr:VanZ family protein [Ruminococcus sp.]